MKFRSLLVLLVLTALSASAADFVCGSSPEVIAFDRDRAMWNEQRQARTASKGGPPNITVRDSVAIVTADDQNAPFRNPIDLDGRSINFRRTGNEAYDVFTGGVVFDEDRGARVNLEGGSPRSRRIGFTYFLFPFFDRNVSAVWIADNNALYIEPPKSADFRQYSDLEVVTQRVPMIAPMLLTRPLTTDAPEIFFKETRGSLTFTWRVVEGEAPYEIQVVLFAGGNMRFSYRNVKNLRAGAIVVTDAIEPWRDRREQLAVTEDFDVPQSPVIDIRRVEVNRLAGLDVIEFRLELAAFVERAAIPEQVDYSIRIGPPHDRQLLTYSLRRDGNDVYIVPGWGKVARSPAAQFDGRHITMHVLQDLIPAAGLETPIQVTANFAAPPFPDGGEVIRMTADIPPATRRARFDFGATIGLTISVGSRPMSEAFTMPAVSVHTVWNQLRDRYSLDPAEYSGVAIYQNFPSDIDFYADAYSTGGNPGADGVSIAGGVGLRFAKSPALLHMNRIGSRANANDRSAARLLMHELGHHWLLSIAATEEGRTTTVLNPVSAHPAQYVDTRAAFPVYGGGETSVMGGGWFAPAGDSKFDTRDMRPYSFTWLELYLMGLAAPAEVPPIFYIDASSPQLAGEYFPPASQTFTGRKREVTLEQILSVMGPRNPAFPDTSRKFKVLFVLLAAPERPVTAAELAAMDGYRRLLAERFRLATNGRGEVMTIFAEPGRPARQRSTR
ncbi:MAG TPA: hypothetical protein VF698_10785 [Thermoanaerobaculia bacterium]|jgi:hypothetical protein